MVRGRLILQYYLVLFAVMVPLPGKAQVVPSPEFRIEAVVSAGGDGITVRESEQSSVNGDGDYTVNWRSGNLATSSTRVSTLPHTLTGLKRGLEYEVYAEVSDSGGAIHTSNSEFVGLPLPPPTLEKLTALGFGGLEVRATPTQGIEGIPQVDCRVYWREDGGESMPESVSAARFPHVLHSLSDAQAYDVYVTAVSVGGESIVSETLTALTSNPQDYFESDSLRLAPGLGFLHRLYSSGDDRFTVWLCDVGDSSSRLEMDGAVEHLRDVLGDYYDWLSGGLYRPVFLPGEVVQSARGYLACRAAAFERHRELIAEGRGDEYRSAGHVLVQLSAQEDGGLSGRATSPLFQRISQYTETSAPGNIRDLFIQENGLDGSLVSDFVLAHELGHTLQWGHSYTNGIQTNGIDVMSAATTLVGTIAINRYTSGWIAEEDVAFYDFEEGGEQSFILQGRSVMEELDDGEHWVGGFLLGYRRNGRCNF